MNSPLGIVFLGSDPIALPALRWLAGEGASLGRLVGVVTKPDRPAGRGMHIHANPIKAWALERGIPVQQPEKLTEEARTAIASLGADLGLVFAYGKILPDSIIETPRFGTVNLHASLLPRYRGASPIQSAIACGETETGLTLMRIVRALDSGPIAGAERVPIGPLDTAAEVTGRLAACAAPLLARSLPRLARGELEFTEQDHRHATACRPLEKQDGDLDFDFPSRILAARVNGLSPWPGCGAAIAGQPLKFGRADCAAGAPGSPPGTVLAPDREGLLVVAGEGLLRLRELQRPGGRMLPAAEFLNGYPIPVGLIIPSRPMTELVRRLHQ